MQKIVIFGYSYQDFSFITSFNALCKEINSLNFSIGLENEAFRFDVNEALELCQTRLDNIETLGKNAFHVTLEQLLYSTDLLTEDMPTTDAHALKSLTHRIKKISCHGAILEALQQNRITSIYGIGNLGHIEAHDENLIETIFAYNTEYTALLVEQNNFVALKDALKSPETLVETFFLTSSRYIIPEDIRESLEHAKIIIAPISTKKVAPHPQALASVLQMALRRLDERMRLSISVKAARQDTYTAQRLHASTNKKNDNHDKMSGALKHMFSTENAHFSPLAISDKNEDEDE